MYKMFGAEYEAPKSDLYADLEGEQVGLSLLSTKKQERLESRKMEAETRGGVEAVSESPKKIDMCIVMGGFNSSNTTHLLEIAQDEGVPGYHIDCADRIGIPGGEVTNRIEHKPLSTPPAVAMMDEGLEVTDLFLPEGPLTIGITSGASTPDKMVGDALQRILAVRGLQM